MKSSQARFLGALALAALVGLALPGVATAQGGKPARPDTRERIKPKQVKWATAVVPAEAAPGETVTYQVTATLDAGWHIYTTDPQPDEGPRHTKFDFFEPAGLTPGKDWKPDRKPITQKEDAFPTLDKIDFFEKTVTWSVPVRVPADAK